ncbi:MAG: tRNA (adenosine(37)-N6)-threonylcarbamoyltransferase complex ATPase subunit type 1 TsaE [Bacteroidales bacterium]|jgi:tRNA threonylcarbamoyladenosine biosynthesis protein TsaE
MKILIRHKKELPSAARKLIDHTKGRRIYAFYGAVGAGKTTIIKAICKLLGASDIVSSPTFTIVNEYRTAKGESLYHIDFYRIKKHDEVFDFGIEEYLSGQSFCFLEWPELIEDILPAETVRVTISVGENEERSLDVVY